MPVLIIAEIDLEDAAIELADILTGLPDNCDLVIATDSSALVPIIEGCMPSCLVTVVPEMRKLIIAVALFYVEKRVNPSISQEKRDTFFLGIRDVYRAYRRLKSPFGAIHKS